MGLFDICSKEYYIIDCENFTFFARKVHIVGAVGCAWNEEINYIIDIPHPYIKEERREMPLRKLTKFKTFKEAQEKAKQLNELPENIKRREEYMNSMQKFLEIKYNMEA